MASSSVSISPTQPSQLEPTTPITVLNHRITIRLSDDNFLLWKAQLTPFLRGQNLFGYVDGSIPPPPRFYHTTSTNSFEQQMLPNPASDLWLQQDQMILSTLLLSLSEKVMAHVVGLATSHEVWTTLNRLFSSQSQARILRIRYQLSTLQRGNLSISDYYQRAKTLAETLAAIGQPL